MGPVILFLGSYALTISEKTGAVEQTISIAIKFIERIDKSDIKK